MFIVIAANPWGLPFSENEFWFPVQLEIIMNISADGDP